MDCVNTSAEVNAAQVVGTQTGEVVVPMYDWASFFGEHFRKVPRMKSYHHFTFTADNPGKVTLKLFSDSESIQYNLLRNTEWVPSASVLPEIIPPAGLSPQRQWYLYDQIREFCREGTEDLVCPLPAVPRPGEQSESDDEDNADEPPPPKRSKTTPSAASPSSTPRRPRCCGKCGKPQLSLRPVSLQALFLILVSLHGPFTFFFFFLTGFS